MPWEDISIEVSTGEAGRSVPSASALLGPGRFEWCIKQSRIDPNNRVWSCGYCALRIGANCSESPATTIRPVGLSDLSTRAVELRDSCPASSMITQSTSKEYRLLKLYSCFISKRSRLRINDNYETWKNEYRKTTNLVYGPSVQKLG